MPLPFLVGAIVSAATAASATTVAAAATVATAATASTAATAATVATAAAVTAAAKKRTQHSNVETKKRRVVTEEEAKKYLNRRK